MNVPPGLLCDVLSPKVVRLRPAPARPTDSTVLVCLTAGMNPNSTDFVESGWQRKESTVRRQVQICLELAWHHSSGKPGRALMGYVLVSYPIPSWSHQEMALRAQLRETVKEILRPPPPLATAYLTCVGLHSKNHDPCRELRIVSFNSNPTHQLVPVKNVCLMTNQLVMSKRLSRGEGMCVGGREEEFSGRGGR
jgi:hypothetical protein